MSKLSNQLEDMQNTASQTDDEIQRLMDRIKLLEKRNNELAENPNNK